VRGRARVEGLDPGALAALIAKYPQYEKTPVSDGSDRLLAIRIEARSSWCASPAAARL
jgi:hypothetical protein